MEISSLVWLHIYPVRIGVCTVQSTTYSLTLHSALYTHQYGLDKYVATRPN
jgi:hypothetical protein